MKRYDTHRNFPPARRPRDSTPAPPEDDELDRLLTASQPTPSDASPEVTTAETESALAGELPAPAPSSVASAVTAYVESLPASDPEPRLEESEIDVDAEAARRAASVALVPESGSGSDVVSASVTRTADANEPPVTADTRPSGDTARLSSQVRESRDADDEEDDDDDEPQSVVSRSSRRSESEPVDSIAAIARSSAPVALPKRGISPALWIVAFAGGGIGLALWSMRTTPELHGKAASEPPTTVVVSPARPEPVPVEPAAIPPPSPSGSVMPPPATSVR